MRLLINVRCCDVVPRGYGFAYHGSYSDTSYCAPIPLNFLIGAWHNFYWYCLVRGWFKQSPLIGVQNFWRGKGFSEGEAYGYETGVRHTTIFNDTRKSAWYEGYEAGKRDGVLAAIKARRAGHEAVAQRSARSGPDYPS